MTLIGGVSEPRGHISKSKLEREPSCGAAGAEAMIAAIGCLRPVGVFVLQAGGW
jgi:hypothetical protein